MILINNVQYKSLSNGKLFLEDFVTFLYAISSIRYIYILLFLNLFISVIIKITFRKFLLFYKENYL